VRLPPPNLGLRSEGAAGPTVIWQPQPGPQTALIQCPVFEVFYGGARGGGKTESSIGDWLEHSNTYGEAAIGIFFRRKLVQLAEVIARTKQLFPKLGAKYNEQQKTWTMANGARLKFAYLEKDSDAEEYQGHSYTRVYVEEVTNFPSPGPIDKLRATLRSGAGVPVGMRLTGNPGGAGHNWVKKRYIDPDPRGFKIITESTDIEYFDPDSGVHVKQTVSLSRVFIPSKIGDNALLMRNDPTYILRLRQSGSAALVKAWLEGNWNIIDGAFFDNWDSDLIVKPLDWLDAIPKHALRFRSFDWGSAKPFSCGWWAVSDGTWGLPVGALLRYREWYGATGANKGLKMDAALVAQGILEREKGEHITYGVADPSIFIRNGGPSIAENMMIKGCMWKKADNKREPGWQQMRMLMGNIPLFANEPEGPKTDPMLFVLETCEDSIRTIPTLQHDEDHAEDLDTEAEDHAADDWRYGVMSRPWVKKAPVPAGSNLPKLPSELTFNEIVNRITQRRLARQNQD
jgi:hypothetical protein